MQSISVKKGNVLVLVAELVDYVNPVEVGHAAIEASALVMKAEVDSESKSEKAARALEKAEEARAEAEKARAEADEKESQTQELAEQLADAEKAAEDAKAAAQNAADEAASQPVAGVIKFKLRGEKLKNTEGLFRKPDPFFALQKPKEDGDDWDNVLISNVERDTLNPSWGEVEVEICALGDGDLDGVLRVVVFDHEKDGKHDLMGFFESSVNGLLSASETDEFISIMRKGRETGQIFVEEADLSGYVDPEETKQQLKELNDKADTARFFVMGKSAAVKSATDAAEEAQSTAEYMAQKAETAAEQAETASSEFEAAKAALEEAASKLAALVE
uniref:C2 domain-containing protein n=1 Tax=Pseudictyota dubia TaxID=2749911 RepID=A0A7R9W1G7_9STRA|mmetsp:Transcript_28635/g.53202  ORF Transcript_28635/g.53202 Transcript_28635/m.53202 type:complete len:332 (+) Transcript_28635:1-996(+)